MEVNALDRSSPLTGGVRLISGRGSLFERRIVREEDVMKEPGLDHRHLDKNGEISRKHGNTLVRTLRRIYGAGFAPGCRDEEKLSDILHEFDEASLSQLHRDHDGRQLEGKIRSIS
jgi:hypothetical protein